MVMLAKSELLAVRRYPLRRKTRPAAVAPSCRPGSAIRYPQQKYSPGHFQHSVIAAQDHVYWVNQLILVILFVPFLKGISLVYFDSLF
jgi:hypothetical protein